jgi:hypothetical protein
MTSQDMDANEELYFLRTAAHPSTPDATRYSNLYIRHHGSGIDSIMLIPTPPKFLRFNTTPSGLQEATSWKNPGRTWGFVLGINDNKRLGGWEQVQIVENEADPGFVWTKTGDGREVLEHKGTDQHDAGWAGWMATDWNHGHPQLFWMTDSMKKELPAFCERVFLVKEPISGQPGTK